MEFLMMFIAIFASAAIGGSSAGVAELKGKSWSYSLLVGLLTSSVIFFIIMVSAVYAPRIILGY